MTIGYHTLGTGKEHVLILHDWFCDCSSYEPLLPYLDLETFTFAFMDVRGYGKSKAISGKYNIEEITQDALSLADSLGWQTFHLIGHSMTGMAVQKIALTAPDRVKSMVAITPVPASGSPAPDNIIEFLIDAATANDTAAQQVIGIMTSNSHGESFARYKIHKWRECSTAEARVAYLKMFTGTNFADQVKGLETPTLVIVGANDAEGHREPVMQSTLCSWLPNCKMIVLNEAGHYPMQEMPVALAETLQEFLLS